MAPLNRGLAPTHPGKVLKDITIPALREAGTPLTEVVRLLGIGRRTLYDVMDERRPVTPELALRLAKLIGNRPEFWLNMQAAWDLAQARDKLGATLDGIPRLGGPVA